MKEALKVSRILHAGYVFEHENVKLLFDPIFENPFSQNCHAFPQVRFDQSEIRKQKFAAVFISHYHDDHCSLASLDLIDRGTPIFIYCIHDELLDLLREFGFLRVEALQIGIGVKVGPFEIIPRLALDADVDSLFQIKVAGLNILNVVDSWIDSHSLQSLARSAPWDLVLWPFQTMREIEVLSPRRAKAAVNSLPAEWLTQLQLLKPRIIVPSSCQFIQETWSWYNNALFPVSYRQFQQEIQQQLPESQVVRMNPSVTLLLHKNSFEYADPLSWVEPVGEQNVDYEYRPELLMSDAVPTTAVIAGNFAALNESERELVFAYCKTGIIEKYASLEPTEYFGQSKLWQLLVYDHMGTKTDFLFLVSGNEMKAATGPATEVAWLTEIPIAKLHSALVNGEALTSLYLRINDREFSASLEQQITEAEVLEDPLVRCLFSGVFGAYQKAQFQKLKTTTKPD